VSAHLADVSEKDEVLPAFEEPIRDFLGIGELEKNHSSNTLESYRNDLFQCARFLAVTDHSDWRTVQGEHISMWINSLSGKKYSIASIARKLSAVKMMAQYLVKEQYRKDDFTALLTAPKKTRILPGTLTEDEVESLLDAPDCATVNGVRDRAILELFYSSGLRVSELVGLSLQDVNLDDCFLRVVSGKGDKQRITPFGVTARDALERYLSFSRPRLVKPNTGSAFFISNRGSAISRKTVWVMVKRYAAAAGIEKPVKPHLLRHSFATSVLSGGADLRVIQELLGHADISTTQIYTSVEQKRLVDQHERCHPRAVQEKEALPQSD